MMEEQIANVGWIAFWGWLSLSALITFYNSEDKRCIVFSVLLMMFCDFWVIWYVLKL